MMRCETCSHECTVVDFVTLRSLCEHLYLDSLAKKHNPFFPSATIPLFSGRELQSLFSRAIKSPAVRGELVPLE